MEPSWKFGTNLLLAGGSGYIEILENKMETTIMGYIGIILGVILGDIASRVRVSGLE